MEGMGGTGLGVVGRRSRGGRRPELALGLAGQGRGLAGAMARRAREGAEAGQGPVCGRAESWGGGEARGREGRGWSGDGRAGGRCVAAVAREGEGRGAE